MELFHESTESQTARSLLPLPLLPWRPIHRRASGLGSASQIALRLLSPSATPPPFSNSGPPTLSPPQAE